MGPEGGASAGRVLVVEDDAGVRALVRHWLGVEGFQVILTENAEEAWKEAVATSPDACVVDLRLPGKDGWWLLEKFRGDPRFARLPLVVLTGLLEPEVVERARSIGCEYLSKPFSGAALVEKVRRAMSWAASLPAPASKKVPLAAREVLVILASGTKITGRAHLPAEFERFSDAWEAVIADRRGFLPLTEARVWEASGAGSEFPLLLVRKAAIEAVGSAGDLA